MTNTAIEALRADREALLAICDDLSAAEWKSDSGCPGWSVRDVVAHMGTLFWMVVDPTTLPGTTDLLTEQAQEVLVEARRSWGPEQVVADYQLVSASALEVLAGFVTQDFEV